MNFIGHATVALWTRSTPEFVLGSMLPDFASMAGTRLARLPASAESDPLAAGIALHHRTDDAFHGATPFVALQQETLDILTSVGVPRGSARAVAHIGAEMFIDGELVRARAVADAYQRALAVERPLAALFVSSLARGASARCDSSLARGASAPGDPDGGLRWARLRERLRSYGVPYDYRDPDSVLRRLQVVLQSRPRLALDAASAPLVRAYLPELQRKVVIALPALLESVREALSSRHAQTD